MNDVTQKQEASGTEITQQAPSESMPLRWRPRGMFDEMERMFDRMHEFFPRGRHWGMPPWFEELQSQVMQPAVDIIDHDSEVIIRAAVPGVKKENLDLSLTENTISLKGKIYRDEKEEKADYYRSEILRGDFSRTLSLPVEVDADRAKATFQDGMLEVVVPKKQPVERKTISIE